MSRTLSRGQLGDIVILMTAAVDALTNAKISGQSADLRLRDLPDHWQEPLWRESVTAAWLRVHDMLGVANPMDLLALPAQTAYDVISDLVGWVDTTTGEVKGVTKAEPLLLRAWGETVSPPSRIPAVLGIGTAGALLGAAIHQFARKR